ncbi:MAG TPA: FAD-binding protein [Jatrophihabitans sp.]|nr:FAD-binding protein [Jatrophihabitans sp.]
MTVTNHTAPTHSVPLDALRSRVAGVVAEPHDPRYQELVTAWNHAVQMQPAAAVAVRSAADVRETVNFARRHGMTVGVQATGHGPVPSLAGHLLVVTRYLDEVTVHADERWARVGAGVKWSRVIEAAAPHGLAPLNGSASDVGVVGYTTGGGVGPMARTFGLAADRVRAFDVVTGDGELRRVTPHRHRDLFFALRGGKGAGGIVTAVEFDLLPIATFYGGAVYFDGPDIPAVIDEWRSWSTTLPEQATTSFVILQLPDAPEMPPPLAGRTTIGVRFLWVGDAAEGARLLDQIRAVAPVLLDDAAIKPYTAVDSVHADPVDPMPVTEASMLLADFPDDAVAQFLDRVGPASQSPQIMVEIRQLGGGYARAGEHPSAFDHRDAAFSLLTVGIAFDPRVAPHASELICALADWDTGGSWPNFAPPHDWATARRAYHPATLAHLADVAGRYDPDAVLAAAAFVRRPAVDAAA